MGQTQDGIMTTDSQASICLETENLVPLMAQDSPQSLHLRKHQVVLEGMVAQILACGSKRL